ncbi:hypothetical protein ACH4NF_26540 [Streptomyces sp. NPDC017248]|uniref:hypothetical protein n=1 Tax=unclassified Streptomyces TaxID=2593676 RepID=UPI003794AD71
MTCATARVRSAALAAAVAGALALTACDGGTSGHTSDASPRPAASATPSTATVSPAVTGAALEGSWITTAGGRVLALVITGTQAGLFSTDRTVCGGTAGSGTGVRTIRLTCTQGAGERTTGTVDSVNGTTLTVTWSGRPGRETYTKAEGGKLPSGFPTRLER